VYHVELRDPIHHLRLYEHLYTVRVSGSFTGSDRQHKLPDDSDSAPSAARSERGVLLRAATNAELCCVAIHVLTATLTARSIASRPTSRRNVFPRQRPIGRNSSLLPIVLAASLALPRAEETSRGTGRTPTSFLCRPSRGRCKTGHLYQITPNS